MVLMLRYAWGWSRVSPRGTATDLTMGQRHWSLPRSAVVPPTQGETISQLCHLSTQCGGCMVCMGGTYRRPGVPRLGLGAQGKGMGRAGLCWQDGQQRPIGVTVMLKEVEIASPYLTRDGFDCQWQLTASLGELFSYPQVPCVVISRNDAEGEQAATRYQPTGTQGGYLEYENNREGIKNPSCNPSRQSIH
jgi:hypothetical protein